MKAPPGRLFLRTPIERLLAGGVLWSTAAGTGGCGAVLPQNPAPLFTMALSVEGELVGPALIDTGGGYEVLLRDSYGIPLVDSVEVLAFGGKKLVAVTAPFTYSVGGLERTADFALVESSICECNGVGFHFFRKTGKVLALDFSTGRADLADAPPGGGVSLDFHRPPPELGGFDSSFIEVDVRPARADLAIRLVGLLDTGSSATVMRRGLLERRAVWAIDRSPIRIRREELGIVAVQVMLFDATGLPDLIIGTDVMRVWSDRWYFTFASQGGQVIAFPRLQESAGAE